MSDFNPQQIKTPNLSSQNDLQDRAVGQLLEQKTFYQANKFYIWAIALSAVIIGVLAYFAFKPIPPPEVKEANVELKINAPADLPSGSEAIYRIEAINNDREKLADLELEIVYPEGFTYISGVPNSENLSGSSFKMNSPNQTPAELAQGVQVLLATIKVKTSGDINAEKKLLAKLHYKYSNFNSSFAKTAEHTLRLTASDIALEIEGPKETNSAQLVAYTIIYKNNSKDAIKNARIKLNYPGGFNYGSSEPKASLGGNIWNIGDLQEGAEGKVALQGTFASSQPGESKTMGVEFQILGENGEYFVQSRAEAVTGITSQPLLVSLENLDQRDAAVVRPGETLNFAVRYQNNAQVAATGVNIAVTLDSKALDLASLQAQAGQLVGNTITWNAAGVPDLESLSPSQSGTLNFYVRVKNPAARDSSKNLSVIISAKIKASEYSTFLPGGSVELKISSPAQIETSLAYQSGSLPPKVGTQTRYRAIIKLLNSGNDFSAVDVSCFLPTALGSFDEQSVTLSERENVQFDQSTGKLTWKAGVLAAHAGKFSPARILEFAVIANPSPSDAGNALVLLRNIKLFAKDNFTGEDIGITTEDITSASLEGGSGYSNGIVVP